MITVGNILEEMLEELSLYALTGNRSKRLKEIYVKMYGEVLLSMDNEHKRKLLVFTLDSLQKYCNETENFTQNKGFYMILFSLMFQVALITENLYENN